MWQLDMNGPRNPVLEELIAQEPENDSIKLVYGDWLLARDNDWGELIALQHALLKPSTEPLFEWDDPAGISASVRERPTDMELLEASSGTLVLTNEAPASVDPRETELRETIETDIFEYRSPHVVWKSGFIQRVFLPQGNGEFRDVLRDTLTRLLEHPAALALEELALGAIEWPDGSGGGSSDRYHRGIHYQDELVVLAALAPQSLRRLTLGAWDEHDISWTAIGELELLYPQLPGLRHLAVQGGFIDLGNLVLPALRSLLIRSGGLYQSAIESLHNAQCPLLESLTLWFGETDYGGPADVAVTEPFLAGTLFPKLRHLGLANSEFADALCPRLARAPVLPRLSTLDLSLGNMSDDGAQVLIDHNKRFSHLEHIDVRGNCISDPMCERLKASFDNITTLYQDSGWRYPSVGE